MCPTRRKRRNRQSQTHTLAHKHTQGGIEALVEAMGRHAESPSAQEAAAGALRSIATNHPENKRKIGAQVASTHECICFLPEENVAIGNKKHSLSHTNTLGGIEALVGAMGRNPASADLQEISKIGCSVLDDLVRLSDFQQRIKRAGAGEAVRRAIAAPAATANTKTWGQEVLDVLKNV
jgi:hypothetical protein